MTRAEFLARASAIVLATGLMAGAAGATAQESITWRVQTGWLPGNTLYDSVVELAERIDVQSEGRLKIEVLPAGAVVALNQTIDSVKAGSTATSPMPPSMPATGLRAAGRHPGRL